jgi:hypothetical protein
MNKKRFFASSVVALALLSFVGMTAVAGADPTSSHSGGAKAVVTGPIRIDQNDPSVAYLTGRYTCPPSTEPAHLFVSAKQVAGGKPDSRLKEEGSSQYTYPDGGWLLRHPGSTEFTCDGAWHTGTWEFSSHSPAPDNYGHGSLVPGTVYVQFCWDGPGETPAWHAYFEQFARASY